MTSDVRAQRRHERSVQQWGPVASALQSAPPEGSTREDLAIAAGCATWDTVEPVGLLVNAGIVTEPSCGRYAPAPGADVPAALTAVIADLALAEEKAHESFMIARAEASLADGLCRLEGR